jgi:hypothetical protein
MSQGELPGSTNPFATARIKPGAITFRCSGGKNIGDIVAAFERAGHVGQIIGPHGSGKSTLLAQLGSDLSARWRTRMVHVRPRQGSSWWRRWEIVEAAFQTPQANNAALTRTLLLVDGFDALGWLSRRALIHHAARRRIGLIVTTHSRQPMPVLYRTMAEWSWFTEVVNELTTGFPPLISAGRVREAFQRHAPNIREALFELYDVYERSRPRSGQSSAGSCGRRVPDITVLQQPGPGIG